MRHAHFFTFLLAGLLLAGAASAVDVTFEVNMDIQEQMGNFDPNVDLVGVNGSMNGWDTGNPFQATDDDNDMIYEVTITGLNTMDFHEYKFVIGNDGSFANLTWEELPSGGNRSFLVPVGDGSLGVVYFSEEDTFNPVLPYEITFQVDMSVAAGNGTFDPAMDGVVIRGGHEAIGNWGGYLHLEPQGNNIYALEVAFDGLQTNSALEYKFVIDVDNNSALPEIWEELPQGGNRSVTPTGDEPDSDDDTYLEIGLDPVYWSDNEGGLNQDTWITYVLDGRPALRKQDDVGIPGLNEEITFFIVTGPWDSWTWTNGDFGTYTLLDDGQGADAVAGDSLFSGSFMYAAGTPLDFTYKYGANGYDNEAGMGANHFIELAADEPNVTIEDDFGTIGDWYDGYYGDPVIPTDVTIMELQTNTEAWEGQLVRVTGIVTIPTATVHTGFTDVYIQDDSGYGINLYDSDINASAGMDRGDEVEVIGVVDQYWDTTELVDFTFSELSSGNALPDPIVFTSTLDFADNAVPFEGTWASLQGVIQDDFDPYDGSYNFSLNSGDGDATVRIWGDTNIDLMDGFAIGDEIIVHGVVDVYSGNPQMMPAVIDDIELVEQGPVVLTLNPVHTTIPPEGGDIIYDVTLQSFLPNLYTGVQYWTTAILPNGNEYGPITQQTFNMPPFLNITQSDLTVTVPAMAPIGLYTFIGRVGYPTMYVEDSFPFTKLEGNTGAAPVDDWAGSLINFETAGETVQTLPESFELHAVYPNPFNPTAAVTVSLPDAAELTVAVYNVMGRQVAELAAGQHQAGVHHFTLDGSAWASGLYFVQAHVPGELNAVQKVTLLK